MNPETPILAEDEITRVTRVVIDEEDAPELAEPNEDVIAVLMRSSDGHGPGPKQLEVSQVWGDALLASRRFALGTTVSVGGGGCAFFAPVLPGGMSRHTLIVGEAMHVPVSWDGFADVGTDRLTFEEMVAAGLARKEGDSYVIPVLGDTRVLVDAGGMLFLARRVSTPQKAPLSPLAMFLSMDFLFMAVAGVTVFVGAAMLFVTWLRPPGLGTAMNDDLQGNLDVIFSPPPPPVPPSAAPPKAKDPTKIGRIEGDKPITKGTPLSKANRDQHAVANSGVLAALHDAAVAQTLGQSGLSSDILGAIGSMRGPTGVMIGRGGFDPHGDHVNPTGSVAGLDGGVGTHGLCVGVGCPPGSSGGQWTKKPDGGPIGIADGDAIVLGSLDKSLIDEVIKRNMSKIRYCYQRELAKDHDLAGKISEKFTIAKDGSVSSATTKSTSMHNNAVEGCIEKTFLRMTFPQPRGGGIVIVSYPFLFSPG